MGGVAKALDIEDTAAGKLLSGADEFLESALTGNISSTAEAIRDYGDDGKTGIAGIGSAIDEAFDIGNSVDTLAEATRAMPQTQADRDEQIKWVKNIGPVVSTVGSLINPLVGAAASGFTSKLQGDEDYIGQLKSGLSFIGSYGGKAVGEAVGGVAGEAGASQFGTKVAEKAGGVIGGAALKTGASQLINSALNSGTDSGTTVATTSKSSVENPSDVDTSSTATASVNQEASKDTTKQLASYGGRGVIGTGTKYNPKVGRVVGGIRVGMV